MKQWRRHAANSRKTSAALSLSRCSFIHSLTHTLFSHLQHRAPLPSGSVTGKNNEAYEIHEVDRFDAGRYTCIADNKVGTATAHIALQVLCKCYVCVSLKGTRRTQKGGPWYTLAASFPLEARDDDDGFHVVLSGFPGFICFPPSLKIGKLFALSRRERKRKIHFAPQEE